MQVFYKKSVDLDFIHDMEINRNTNFYIKVKKRASNEQETTKIWFILNWGVETSFPIGLVKTESGFIVRSIETDLGRWTLVVALISVDAYPF